MGAELPKPDLSRVNNCYKESSDKDTGVHHSVSDIVSGGHSFSD